MLCGYGCGQEAIKQFGNGKVCCSEKSNSCPEICRRNKEGHVGKKCSEETLRKMRESHIGKNTGKRGPRSEETKRSQREKMKGKNRRTESTCK